MIVQNASSRGHIAAHLLVFATFLVASVASATPFAAFTDHTGEDHSSEDHRTEYLESIILTSGDLTSTKFNDADLTRAIGISAVFDKADFRNANLTEVNFANASIVDAKAQDANFTNAILDGVMFGKADVKNSVFVGVSLLGADLSQLKNADKADFTGAYYDALTILSADMDASSMNFVPEPSSSVLLGLGLLGLEAYGRRMRRD